MPGNLRWAGASWCQLAFLLAIRWFCRTPSSVVRPCFPFERKSRNKYAGTFLSTQVVLIYITGLPRRRCKFSCRCPMFTPHAMPMYIGARYWKVGSMGCISAHPTMPFHVLTLPFSSMPIISPFFTFPICNGDCFRPVLLQEPGIHSQWCINITGVSNPNTFNFHKVALCHALQLLYLLRW